MPLKANVIKKVCDGEVDAIQLYQHGSKSVKVNATLMMTSNQMLMFDSEDTGIQRRIMFYHCKSKFVTDPDKVDHANHIYQALPFKFDQLTNEQKTVMFLYFSKTCPYILHDQDPMKILPPKCFRNDDGIQNFTNFDELMLKRTKGKTVQADHMLQAISLFFPLYKPDPVDLVKTLKKKLGITYKERNNKGYYVNVDWNHDNSVRLVNGQPLFHLDGTEE